MSCPTDKVAEVNRPDGADVDFEAAVPNGGQAPYAVECTPNSGSVFPIGETPVECTVTSADMQRASCGFGVRVRVSQTLSRTQFMAFGDSITDGAISLAPLIMLGPPDTYPYKLEQMLLQRYPVQTFVVSNEGKGGEQTWEGARRLPSVIDAQRPEVLLLLEGVNNVKGLSTSRQVDAFRSMLTTARRRDVEVIIATVMAISQQRELDHPGTAVKIEALNRRILDLADEYGLGPVVDLFGLFQTNPHLLGADGLHPTAEGQTRIAEAFRDEIVRRYESRATMTSRLGKLAHDAR